MRWALFIWLGLASAPSVLALPWLYAILVSFGFAFSFLKSAPTYIAYVLLVLGACVCAYGYSSGSSISEILLTLMLVVIVSKAIESSTKRDYQLLVLTGWVMAAISITHLQGLIAFVYLLVTLLLGLAVMQSQALVGQISLRQIGRITASSVTLSLPLLIILYLFVPRLTGPLVDLGIAFGLPVTVGVDDKDPIRRFEASLSQGSLHFIQQKDSPVLVAEFKNTTPYKSEMYWRGPIYWTFDGNTWKTNEGAETRSGLLKGAYRKKQELDRVTREKEQYFEYVARVLPNGSRYLYGLETSYGRSPETFISRDFQLVGIRETQEEFVYEMGAYLSFVGGELSEQERLNALQLPNPLNEAERFLAWVDENIKRDTPSESVMAWQAWLASGAFEVDPSQAFQSKHWDDLFFKQQSGSVETLATLTAIAFRHLNIPTRVVSGYQGGNIIALTNFVVVKNEHAHVWLDIEEKGAWKRFDPTDWLQKGTPLANKSNQAATRINSKEAQKSQRSAEKASKPVATDRLTSDTSSSKEAREKAVSPWTWLAKLDQSMDNWIIHFNSNRQVELSEKIGLEHADWRWLSIMGLALLVMTGGLMKWVILSISRSQEDQVERLFEKFNHLLTKKGFACTSNEPVEVWAKRISNVNSEISTVSEAITCVIQTYLSLRYYPHSEADEAKLVQRFKRQIKQVSGLL
jgi:hypothetical protein